MSGSLTRRQLLIRTGGASVALACFGALPMGAIADSAALSPARAATYAALLDAIDADPAYDLVDRRFRARRFTEIYAAADDSFRDYADAVLDDLEQRGLGTVTPTTAHDRLSAGALDLAGVPFVDDNDTHTIVFTI